MFYKLLANKLIEIIDCMTCLFVLKAFSYRAIIFVSIFYFLSLNKLKKTDMK